jgi:hypothetical protein
VVGTQTMFDAVGTWLSIAEEHEVIALRARKVLIAGLLPDADSRMASTALRVEFRASMQAVVAAATAIEALDYRETGGKDGGAPVRDQGSLRNSNAAAQAPARLAVAWDLSEPDEAQLRRDLAKLADDRQTLVHPKPEWRDGIYPHPSGTNTAAELAYFTAELASEAVGSVRKARELGVAAEANGAGANETE